MSAKHPVLNASVRNIFGKKNNALRRSGFLPIKVTDVQKNTSHLSVSSHDLVYLFQKYGKSAVIDLVVDEKKSPVMLVRTQVHPVTHRPLHAEFHQVNLKQKTHAQVEIVLTGESPVIKSNEGVITHLVDTVSVEALPDDIPAHIEIDISGMEVVGAEIKVSDLPKIEKVVYLDDPEKPLIRIVAHRQHAVEPELEIPETEVIGEGEEVTTSPDVETAENPSPDAES